MLRRPLEPGRALLFLPDQDQGPGYKASAPKTLAGFSKAPDLLGRPVHQVFYLLKSFLHFVPDPEGTSGKEDRSLSPCNDPIPPAKFFWFTLEAAFNPGGDVSAGDRGEEIQDFFEEGVATGGRCGLLAVFVEDLGLAKGIIVVALYDRTIASTEFHEDPSLRSKRLLALLQKAREEQLRQRFGYFVNRATLEMCFE